MSDDEKLIEDLRDTLYFVPSDTPALCNSAADRIEALEVDYNQVCNQLAAANERLATLTRDDIEEPRP
jgi:uncharacterized protein YpuA (DUF1002 family)